MRRTLALVAVVLAGLPLPAVAGSYDASNGQMYQKLVPAPAFNIAPVSGGPVQLGKYAGKVRIVDFWATWCPPCVGEIPGFVALQKRYGSKGVQVLGLSVDKDMGQLQAFLTKNGVNYPVGLADAATQAAYGGVRAIPTTFVIGRKGFIYKKYVGGVDPSQFEADIQALL